MGYRYFNSFGKKTAFPFGHGLSYTGFSYDKLKLSSKKFKGTLTVSVDVTNTGNAAGKEAVQLYLSAPGKSMDKPVMELKGFAKTGLLKPSESQTLRFTLNEKDLASFDTGRTAWVAEKGTYTLHVAASSEDIRLKGSFLLRKEKTVEKVHKVLFPDRKIKDSTGSR